MPNKNKLTYEPGAKCELVCDTSKEVVRKLSRVLGHETIPTEKPKPITRGQHVCVTCNKKKSRCQVYVIMRKLIQLNINPSSNAHMYAMIAAKDFLGRRIYVDIHLFIPVSVYLFVLNATNDLSWLHL